MGSFDFSGIAALANEEGRVQQAEPNAYAQQQGLAIERQQAAQEKQLNDQKIQAQQIQLNDQKASSAAMREWDGTDMNALPGLMIKHGASANAVFSMKNGILDYASKQSTKNKTDLENDKALHDEVAGALSPGTDAKQVSDADLPNWIRSTGKSLLDGGKIDPQHEATVEQLAQLPPEQARQQLEVYRKGYMAQSQINDELAKKAEANQNNAKAANENAQAGLNQIKLNLAKDSKPGDFDAQIDAIFPANTRSTSGPNQMYKSLINSALKRGDLDSAKQYVDQASQSQAAINKEIAIATNPQIQAGKAAGAAAEAKATQPYKIEQAAAEGKARQLIQGMTEPVYAYVQQPGGPPQKTLMSKTDALQAGIKTMLPVTEKEVGEDTLLINRLSDVRQKIGRYDQSLQSWLGAGNAVNRQGEASSIAGLLSSDKFKVGAFGAELPVDRLNQIADQANIKLLSARGRDALIAYYNAREALVGYNRVLSGSGKSSDKSLELQEQTLPSPVSADKDYAARSIQQFKENLDVVGQGLPKIPGVKSPEDWEQQATPRGRSTNPRYFPSSGTGAGYLKNLLGGK
jgi:hypothetical protein